MSQQDGFASGFLTGAVVGGLIGGLIGALVTAGKSNQNNDEEDRSMLNSERSDPKAIRARRRELKAEASIEAARQSLEDKIAQLNSAIDDVRQQVSTVKGTAEANTHERVLEP
ncbi:MULTISPECIES: hypothetical protein [unclassified Moorena]|uniref:hypothetical protein n=1 Tax=unclassified Moorena TaxID=2683338 RepID=UPI0014014A16|nr:MULTISPECIES: hypothetical protein [unclassified Moorena]NEO12296.1 hypothetical protein [Moorena sp. SIO3E8]NEP98939.1 hypothetical protein [Moorena sp. SIO3F7]